MGEYRNTKPDSPKGQVYTAFANKGRDAAKAVADKHGIADGRFERWMREWDGTDEPAGAKPEKSEKAPPEKEKSRPADVPSKPSRKKASQAPTGLRERVFDVGQPNVHGTIVTRGEQVSVVRWDVSSPWGATSNVSNEQLRPAEDEPTEKDRWTFHNATAFLVMKKNDVVGTFQSFGKAVKEASDEALWVFARTKGGGVALLQRPHWEQYKLLEKHK